MTTSACASATRSSPPATQPTNALERVGIRSSRHTVQSSTRFLGRSGSSLQRDGQTVLWTKSAQPLRRNRSISAHPLGIRQMPRQWHRDRLLVPVPAFGTRPMGSPASGYRQLGKGVLPRRECRRPLGGGRAAEFRAAGGRPGAPGSMEGS